jgi:hypothetical protein
MEEIFTSLTNNYTPRSYSKNAQTCTITTPSGTHLLTIHALRITDRTHSSQTPDPNYVVESTFWSPADITAPPTCAFHLHATHDEACTAAALSAYGSVDKGPPGYLTLLTLQHDGARLPRWTVERMGRVSVVVDVVAREVVFVREASEGEGDESRDDDDDEEDNDAEDDEDTGDVNFESTR